LRDPHRELGSPRKAMAVPKASALERLCCCSGHGPGYRCRNRPAVSIAAARNAIETLAGPRGGPPGRTPSGRCAYGALRAGRCGQPWIISCRHALADLGDTANGRWG